MFLTGGMGLVAVKNLLEEGFQVTGFEKSGYVGGLWHFNEDPETLSVLESRLYHVMAVVPYQADRCK